MGYDIQLVVTVRGPQPWSKPGGDLVKRMLVDQGSEVQSHLSHLSGPDKPADWQKVEVDYRVFEESYAWMSGRRRHG